MLVAVVIILLVIIALLVAMGAASRRSLADRQVETDYEGRLAERQIRRIGQEARQAMLDEIRRYWS